MFWRKKSCSSREWTFPAQTQKQRILRLSRLLNNIYKKMKGVEKLFKHLDESLGRSSRRKEARRRRCELPGNAIFSRKCQKRSKKRCLLTVMLKKLSGIWIQYQVSIVYDGSQSQGVFAGVVLLSYDGGMSRTEKKRYELLKERRHTPHHQGKSTVYSNWLDEVLFLKSMPIRPSC